MARIDIPSGCIEYVDQGSGEPVVLLHSSGASSAQWRALTQRLAPDYRVIAPDLYGYGASSAWGGRSAFSLAQEAAFVIALLGRLGQPAHLVGHSYGGAVALHVARTRGDLVRGLTVIEPVAFHLLRGGSDRDLAALREIEGVTAGVGRALASGDYDAGYRGFVDYWSGSGTWAGIPMAKRVTLAPQLAKVALDFHATLHEPATLDDFRMLAVPTLVMQGACTKSPTHCICERLATALPEASLMTIPGAGHMLPLTHREQVNDLVMAHIEGLATVSEGAGGEGGRLALFQ
jgi:pimeloyl-ACP methyl ester carboxylesterase